MTLPDSLLVIADDFTGACDAAGRLATADHPCRIRFDRPASRVRGDHPDGIARADRIVVWDTETRNCSARAARRRIRSLTELLTRSQELAPAAGPRILKKIDSTLRGNVAAELREMNALLPRHLFVVSPAFPATGRVVVDGECLVHGVPLGATEFARDTTPGRSRVADYLPSDATVLQCRPETLWAELSLAKGGTCLVVDARTAGDLGLIVDSVLGSSLPCILVGSSGLAGAVASHMSGSPEVSLRAAPGPQSPVIRPVLAVVGSLSEASRTQVARLSASHKVSVFLVGNKSVVSDRGIARCLRAGESAVVLTPEATMRPIRRAACYASRLATIARRAMDARPDLALVLTGGDTAHAVVRRLGASGVTVIGEIQPGVPIVTIAPAVPGGIETLAVTKAGGFGTEDVMIQAFNYLGSAP